MSHETPLRDDRDIPFQTRRELMACATANGTISYYYLCEVYRKGRAAAIPTGHAGQDEALERAVAAVCSMKCASTWRTVDGPPPHSEECVAIHTAMQRLALLPVESAPSTPQMERLFEAVVHTYEGDDDMVPQDLREASFVRRARRFREKGPSVAPAPPPVMKEQDEESRVSRAEEPEDGAGSHPLTRIDLEREINQPVFVDGVETFTIAALVSFVLNGVRLHGCAMVRRFPSDAV